jgi:DNA-binding CsgD family transcriptional regulator
VATAAGDLRAAASAAEVSVELSGRLDERFVSAWAGVAFAGALVPGGDPARATTVLIRAAGGDDLPFVPGGWRAMALEMLTRGLVAVGRHDAARAATARAEALADATRLPMTTVWARRARAVVDLAVGEPDAAAAAALTSAAAAAEAGARVEAALSRLVAGAALAHGDRREEAVVELERAAADFAVCGAIRHRDAAERELRKLGRRVQRRPMRPATRAEGIASLTGRELEIARLVVDRKTNAEIAAHLFLSLKTVETHLRNLFRKLDVSSRAEVARTVERADRAGGDT